MKVNIYRLTGDKIYLDGLKVEEDVVTLTNNMVSKILNKFFNLSEGANMMLQMMYN